MGHESRGYFRYVLMTWEMVQLARQVNKVRDQFLSGGGGKGENGENTSRKSYL